MTRKESLQIVEMFLNKHHKTFPTSGELLAHQRGLLTGLVASIIKEDFYAANLLLRHLKEIDEQARYKK